MVNYYRANDLTERITHYATREDGAIIAHYLSDRQKWKRVDLFPGKIANNINGSEYGGPLDVSPVNPEELTIPQYDAPTFERVVPPSTAYKYQTPQTVRQKNDFKDAVREALITKLKDLSVQELMELY